MFKNDKVTYNIIDISTIQSNNSYSYITVVGCSWDFLGTHLPGESTQVWVAIWCFTGNFGCHRQTVSNLPSLRHESVPIRKPLGAGTSGLWLFFLAFFLALPPFAYWLYFRLEGNHDSCLRHQMQTGDVFSRGFWGLRRHPPAHHFSPLIDQNCTPPMLYRQG